VGLVLVLVGLRQQRFFFIFDELQLFKKSLLIGQRLPAFKIQSRLDLGNLLLVEVGFPSEFLDSSLTFSILNLEILDSAESSLQLLLVALDPSLELRVGMLAFLNFPADIFLKGKALPTLPFYKILEFLYLIFV